MSDKGASQLTQLSAGDTGALVYVVSGGNSRALQLGTQAFTDSLPAGTAYQALDTGQLTPIAALSTTTYGRSLLTLADDDALAAQVDSFFLTPAEGAAAYQPLDADLTTLGAGGAAARLFLGLDTGDNPQFNTIQLGAAADTTLSRSAAGVMAVEGVPVYSQIPQNSKSAAYTTVLADAQKHILHPTADNNARTFTIDSNANVAYPIGTCLTFINQINTVTISITSDTLTLAGAGTTGSRTLAANGIATAIKIASTSWIISGTGLT